MKKWWDKCTLREKKLVVAFSCFILLGLLGGGPGYLSSRSNSIRSENESNKELIETLVRSKSIFQEAKDKSNILKEKYNKGQLKLASFLQEATKSNGISGTDIQDRPDLPIGKSYLEKQTILRMHKIGLKELINTISQIKSSAHPLTISKLNLKLRPSEPDSYEVEMGVSLFERKETSQGIQPSTNSKEIPEKQP